MCSIYEIIHIWSAVDESEKWSSQLIFQFKKFDRISLKKSGLQMVEFRTGIRGGHGFESLWSLDFSGFFFVSFYFHLQDKLLRFRSLHCCINIHACTGILPNSANMFGLSKDSNIDHSISWHIISSHSSYNSSSERCQRCNLCLERNFFKIIYRPDLSSLNKRNELVSSCRHRKKSVAK